MGRSFFSLALIFLMSKDPVPFQHQVLKSLSVTEAQLLESKYGLDPSCCGSKATETLRHLDLQQLLET